MTGRSGPSAGRLDLLDGLLEYVCKHFYGDIYAAHSMPGARYVSM